MTINPNATAATARVNHALPESLQRMVTETRPRKDWYGTSANTLRQQLTATVKRLHEAQAEAADLRAQVEDRERRLAKMHERIAAEQERYKSLYKPNLTWRVINFCSDRLRISVDEMLGPVRRKELVHARKITAWCVLKATGRSHPEVGRAMKRDHSTIVHAKQCVERSPKLLTEASDLLKEFFTTEMER
jgi:chromosomal replication initiation ATPase DnaA